MENKAIVIANGSFSDFRLFEPEYQCIYYDLTDDLQNNVEYIRNANASFLFVLLEVKLPGSTSGFGGLEFIVWLRINAIKTPVIAVSFQSLEYIIKQTKYANIVASKGVFFYQLSCWLDEHIVYQQVKESATINSIKTACESFFDIANFRHSYANTWGLNRLISAYNFIYPDNRFYSADLDSEAALGLNYHVARFYYSKKEEKNDYLIKHIKDKVDKLKTKANYLRIVLIDDKANSGWLAFLRHLFNETVEMISIDIKSFTNDEVVTKFKKLIIANRYYDRQFRIDVTKPIEAQISAAIQNKNYTEAIWKLVTTDWFYKEIYVLNREKPISFIVSDLRLFSNEASISNYKDFVSMQLMEKVLKTPSFSRMRYVLFTASNQILNFKFLFNHNQYAPSDVFIKEGFDIQYTSDQKYLNLDHLLSTLLRVSAQSARNKTAIVGKADIDSEVQIAFFEENYNNGRFYSDFELHKNFLDNFSHIILDSNLYFDQEPILPLYPTNLIVPYTVYKELYRNLAKDGAEEYKGYMSNHFLSQNHVKLAITSDCFSSTSLQEIDRRFKSKDKKYQIADDFFSEAIKYYCSQMPNSKVLFVTNDTERKGPNKSPIYDIIDWANLNSIDNLTICSFRQKQFEHHFPTTTN